MNNGKIRDFVLAQPNVDYYASRPSKAPSVVSTGAEPAAELSGRANATATWRPSEDFKSF